jgi:hypothetical protein
MNHIIYNISLILLLLGIIILTSYLSKANSQCNIQVPRKEENKENKLATKVYSKMFNQPEPWLGYESFTD